jgi:hypothetical protein
VISVAEGHPHDLVATNTDELFLLLTVEADNKEADPVVWEGLPGLDEVHFGLEEVEVLHIGVGLKDSLAELKLFM